MKRPRVAILQSDYLPWKGFFDIIHDVDLLVFYDDVQYTPRDWRSRNRVKAARGAEWISVPVGNSRDRLICDVAIPDAAWQATHWRTLQQNYGKTPHFARYRDYFEHVYCGTQWTNLSTFNQTVTRHIATEFLGIRTEYADSRSYRAEGAKQERIVSLVRATGAGTYVSGPAARDYLDAARFDEIGVELVWKDYGGYPEYPQRFPPFDHGVSIVDLLFNTGPDATWYIWGWREGGAPPLPQDGAQGAQ